MPVPRTFKMDSVRACSEFRGLRARLHCLEEFQKYLQRMQANHRTDSSLNDPAISFLNVVCVFQPHCLDRQLVAKTSELFAALVDGSRRVKLNALHLYVRLVHPL